MKRTVMITATVEGDGDMRAANYIADALEVGLDGGPQQDYGVAMVTVDSVDVFDLSPELDDALDQVRGFTDAQRSDFYGRLANSARSIAERIEEDAAIERERS